MAFPRKEGQPGDSIARPPTVSMRTPADILKLLEQLTAAVLADPYAEAATKARAVGHLAALALKAIEVDHLRARLELLEAVFKTRPREAE